MLVDHCAALLLLWFEQYNIDSASVTELTSDIHVKVHLTVQCVLEWLLRL